MNTRKLSNIIFGTIVVSLCGAFAFQMYKFGNYRKVVEDLKENMLNAPNTNNSVTDDTLYEPIDNVNKDNINYDDRGAALEQKNPPKYYTLDVINLEILENYIPTENNQMLEVYSTMANILKSDLHNDTTSYIEESSIVLNGNILSLSLIDVNTRNKIKDFKIDIFIPNENTNTDEFIVTVSNLSVVNEFVSDNKEGLVKIHHGITESLNKDIKSDIVCYIDASTIANNNGILSFIVKDVATKKAIKTVSIKL